MLPLSNAIKQRLGQYNNLRKHTGSIDTNLSPDEWNKLLAKGITEGLGNNRKLIITALCRRYIYGKNRRL